MVYFDGASVICFLHLHCVNILLLGDSPRLSFARSLFENGAVQTFLFSFLCTLDAGFFKAKSPFSEWVDSNFVVLSIK